MKYKIELKLSIFLIIVGILLTSLSIMIANVSDGYSGNAIIIMLTSSLLLYEGIWYLIQYVISEINK